MVLMSVTEARLKTHCAETKIFTKLYTQLSKLCNKLKIYFIFERREEKHELGPFLWLKIRSKTWKFWWFICFVDECRGKKVAYPLI